MKIHLGIPGRARSFEELLETVRSPAYRAIFPRLLKTAWLTGYLTDGVVITRLSPEERRAVEKLDVLSAKALAAYEACRPLDVGAASPRLLGPKAEEAVYAGPGKSYEIVLLRGAGRELLVEARAFLTLARRHPFAEWRFAKGRTYRARPVTLVHPAGALLGMMLGALQPLKVNAWADGPLPYSEDCLELKGSGEFIEYLPSSVYRGE